METPFELCPVCGCQMTDPPMCRCGHDWRDYENPWDLTALSCVGILRKAFCDAIDNLENQEETNDCKNT